MKPHVIWIPTAVVLLAVSALVVLGCSDPNGPDKVQKAANDKIAVTKDAR